jgi:hypothetical protein
VAVNWDAAMADPTFVDALREAQADFKAGRGYRYVKTGRRVEFIPLDTWRADDVVQPEGWRYDGTRWVRA